MPSTLISSIGLFWREDFVFWGGGNRPGRLLGVPSHHRSVDPIDFREQVGIYVLYAGFTPIYVGQTRGKTKRLFQRLKDHRNDDLAGRWDKFSWFGTRKVLYNSRLAGVGEAVRPTRKLVLNHIEGILIHALEPPLNGQSGRFGKKVKRYLQIRDENIGLTNDAMLKELLKLAREQ